jgi:hypothetical protein
MRPIRMELLAEHGTVDGESKIDNYRAMGPAPMSVVHQHNQVLEQVRSAFAHGDFYPASLLSRAVLPSRPGRLATRADVWRSMTTEEASVAEAVAVPEDASDDTAERHENALAKALVRALQPGNGRSNRCHSEDEIRSRLDEDDVNWPTLSAYNVPQLFRCLGQIKPAHSLSKA